MGELALRYNDKSPLENMHCARLFEICSRAETDVFEKADSENKKHARKVCIASILHTDNVNHFEMVKEISKVYEFSSEVCEEQARHPARARATTRLTCFRRIPCCGSSSSCIWQTSPTRSSPSRSVAYGPSAYWTSFSHRGTRRGGSAFPSAC